MKYISITDLNKTIRNNFHKIPHDVDAVLGIPRSGMIPASIISELLNVRLSDINSFVKLGETCFENQGMRCEALNSRSIKKILVVDDTVFNGTAMEKAKKLLGTLQGGYEFVFMCVYQEGPNCEAADIKLEDLRLFTDNFRQFVFYEWNIFNHYEFCTTRFIYDMDGVLDVDPPDERNTSEYERYIQNATPLFIPTSKIGSIVTYRLEKYREITEKWLRENNVKYNNLIMFNADSWDDRFNSGITSAKYKAEYYKSNDWAILFIESEDRTAREIFELTGKPVLSIECNKLYS